MRSCLIVSLVADPTGTPTSLAQSMYRSSQEASRAAIATARSRTQCPAPGSGIVSKPICSKVMFNSTVRRDCQSKIMEESTPNTNASSRASPRMRSRYGALCVTTRCLGTRAAISVRVSVGFVMPCEHRSGCGSTPLQMRPPRFLRRKRERTALCP